MVTPWAIPGEVIYNHKNQGHSESRGDLRKGGGSVDIFTSGTATAYTVVKYFVVEYDGAVKEGDRENPVADEEERAEQS